MARLRRALSMRIRRIASAAAAKKWAPPIEFRIGLANQAQPGLMHQRGGLQSVVGRFPCHSGRGELAQFAINQRQQFVGGFGVAMLDGFKNAGNVAQWLRRIANLTALAEGQSVVSTSSSLAFQFAIVPFPKNGRAWIFKYALWRSKPIKAAVTARCLRIAKGGQAIAIDIVGGHGKPNGVSQVGAGFHDKRGISRAGNAETKLCAGAIQCRRLRVPQLHAELVTDRWHRCPAHCPWQIVNKAETEAASYTRNGAGHLKEISDQILPLDMG